MAYETWFHLHVLGYLAVVLALGHVLVSGSDFVGNVWAQAWWIGLYVLVGIMVVVGRFGPLLSSLLRPLRVTRVDPLPERSIEVWLGGRRLPRLQASAGQYFQLRFGVPGLWWNSHPSRSVSAPYTPKVCGSRFGPRATMLQLFGASVPAPGSGCRAPMAPLQQSAPTAPRSWSSRRHRDRTAARNSREPFGYPTARTDFPHVRTGQCLVP